MIPYFIKAKLSNIQILKKICNKFNQNQQQNLNVHIILLMSYFKVKAESIQLQRQKSIDMQVQQNDHYLQHLRKKYKRSKNKRNIHSLHSLDANRGSLNLQQLPKSNQRRNLLGIHASDSKSIFTERPEISEETSKKTVQPKPIPFQFRHRSDKMQTIDHSTLECKQKKIKDCIEMMQGVLQEIKNQKSNRKVIVNRLAEDLSIGKRTLDQKASVNSGSQSKFESYIKNITQLKQQNKIILMKKISKTKSVISKENVCSSIVLNANKFQSILKGKLSKDVSIRPVTKKVRKETISFIDRSITKQNNDAVEDKQQQLTIRKNRLDQIQCSSIDNVNQSSFISQFGKKSLIKHLEDEPCCHRQLDAKKAVKIPNNRKIRNIFPDDFF